jgi:site-specific DNA-cytosine methylase
VSTGTTSFMEIRHFHLFAGLGGGARGFNMGEARVGNLVARYRCLGGIDNDPAAMRDFASLAGVPGTVLDLFDREQYRAFHGREPGADWREATPQDLHRAAGGERPHIVFLSAPCKGFSGLLSEVKSLSAKYQALNRLTLRGVWLMLEAWADDPPELVLFENVPRLATRGRVLLDRITAMLRAYGYATAETTHDCGALGNLAQSRKRFLLVARHVTKVPPLLYEPHKTQLRAVSTVLGRMPAPGDPRAGPMHRIPSLQWKTWVRLAFIAAGSDWRSLNRLAVENGSLRDYVLVPSRGEADSSDFCVSANGGDGQASAGSLVLGQTIGDQRPADNAYGKYEVNDWCDPARTVISGSTTGQGAFAVADPRQTARGRAFTKYPITPYFASTGTVIGGDDCGAYAVADPRSGLSQHRGAYLSGGHYGVVPWDQPSGTVSGSACHDNGRWSVADPRSSWFASEP